MHNLNTVNAFTALWLKKVQKNPALCHRKNLASSVQNFIVWYPFPHAQIFSKRFLPKFRTNGFSRYAAIKRAFTNFRQKNQNCDCNVPGFFLPRLKLFEAFSSLRVKNPIIGVTFPAHLYSQNYFATRLRKSFDNPKL